MYLGAKRRYINTLPFLFFMGWFTIYTFWGLLSPNGILPAAIFTLHPSLAFSNIDSFTARHSSSDRQPNFAASTRGRHLYSAGRPSRWASTHILVDQLYHKTRSLKWLTKARPIFWTTACKTVRPMLSDRCLSVCLSVCLSCLSVTLVYCGQTV